jgi:hypothetical protein
MKRDRALKIVLVLIGLLFTAMVYPLVLFVKQEPALAMMMSLYVTLGLFLMVAARNPSANRSMIAFTAWSSFAHAAVMSFQAFRNLIARCGMRAQYSADSACRMWSPSFRNDREPLRAMNLAARYRQSL